MRNKGSLWGWLAMPPLWFMLLCYALTLGAAIGSLCMLAVDYTAMPLAAVAYTLFGTAAVTLGYSVYTLVRFAPRLRRFAIRMIERYTFTRRLKESFGFRTVVFSIVSFAISIFNAVINGVQGILTASVWFGALAAYYVLLALMRGGVLYSRTRTVADEVALRKRQACTHLACGILLLVLQLALSAAIAQMIFDNRAFVQSMEWMVYASAAYAFYKIITAVIHFVKAARLQDLEVGAICHISLVDATVSILALQTTLLAAFGDAEMRISDFNTVTGCAVTLINLTLGVLMILRGIRHLRKINTEKKNVNGK